MQITTTAENGYLRVYLYDSDDQKLLSLFDSGTATVNLKPGTTYKLEYHYWSSIPAKYTINAVPPFLEYPGGIKFDRSAGADADNIIDVTTAHQ